MFVTKGHPWVLPAVALCLAQASACRHVGPMSAVAAAPATDSVADAQVSDGWLVSKSPKKDAWVFEIREQLQFAVGAFAGRGAVADLDSLQLSVQDDKVRLEEGVYFVPYVARFSVGWRGTLPGVTTFVLPRGGDDATLTTFLTAYADKCRDASEEVTVASYWHQYRPEAPGCPLLGETLEKQLAQRVTVEALPAKMAGAPDYQGIWADKRLAVLALVATEADYQALLGALGEQCGAPSASSASDARFAKTFEGHGELAVHVLWVGEGALSREVRDVVAAEASTTDLVAVVGGGTLKGAASVLVDRAEFVFPDARLVFLAARDSFAYVDRDLASRIAPRSDAAFVAEAASTRLGASAGGGLGQLLATLSRGEPSYDEIASALRLSGKISLRAAPAKLADAPLSK